MKKSLIVLIFLGFSLQGFAQKMEAYKIYDAKGKKVSYKKFIRSSNKADIILFGELHNNPIAHWLQLELTKELYKSKGTLSLGAEMMEADNQQALDAYLQKSIDQKALDTLARLWPNYDTDYAPLINFAQTNGLSFTACNIPRRFASMVYKGGFEALDTLSELQKSWIAPLPIKFDPELPQYKNILEMMGKHGSPKLVMAQAIKDATMAHFILKTFKPNQPFIHYNGAYHSDFHEGILWYLQQAQPNLSYLTISTVEQKNVHKLEEAYKNKADFIIVVDSDMTKTY